MKTNKLTRSAMLLALTLVFQIGFRQFAQPLVGPLVNMMLLLSTMIVGIPMAIIIGCLTPIIAFLAGIMGVFPLVPMIALGNAVYIIVFGLIIEKKEEVPQQVLGLVVSSIGKFLFLYMAVRTLLPLFIPEVKPPIIATFSLPQLWTALIGGALAIIIIKLLPKSIR